MRAVGAVILAAGGSTRFGQPKQLLAFNGESLVLRAVRAASEAACAAIVVVVGDEGERIGIELRTTAARIVHNGGWRRGPGTSIRRGLEHLLHMDAVVLMACDQPLVNASVIRALIAAREQTRRPIAACRYAKTLGVPALFDGSCFSELMKLPDDSGAKALIAADPGRVAEVEFEGGSIDLDTPEDFERLQSLHQGG